MALMDPLVEVPTEMYPDLRDSFKRHWPRSVSGYYVVQNQINYPQFKEICQFVAYCPYGDIDNGMISISIKGGFYEVVVQPNSRNIKKIEEALATTKRIDWTREVCFSFADNEVLRMIRQLRSRLFYSIVYECPTFKHFLSRDTTLYDISQPPNTYTGSLERKHLPRLDSTWPHQYDGSYKFFESLIVSGLTYGLFSSADRSLIAWICICDVGLLTHLYCEEPHRGRGYGEYITKYCINDQLMQDRDVLCCICEDNTASLKLFRKLGFDVVGRGVWTYVKRESLVVTNGK